MINTGGDAWRAKRSVKRTTASNRRNNGAGRLRLSNLGRVKRRTKQKAAKK